MSYKSVDEFMALQPSITRRRRVVHPLMRLVGYSLCKVEVTGLERIPTTGAAILMINHINFIDPIVFTALSDRFVTSMAKAETLDDRFVSKIVWLWGNFVVQRDTVDREALTIAIELLQNEQLLLIAPEGTRNPDGLHEAKSGLAYIAHKTDAVIIPAAIGGAQDSFKRLKRFRRAYAKVNFGRAFRLKLPEGERLSKQIREEMTREALYQLALAMPEGYEWQRGFYADVDKATCRYLEFVGDRS